MKKRATKSDFLQVRLQSDYIYKLDFLAKIYNEVTYAKLIKKIIDIEMLKFQQNIK